MTEERRSDLFEITPAGRTATIKLFSRSNNVLFSITVLSSDLHVFEDNIRSLLQEDIVKKILIPCIPWTIKLDELPSNNKRMYVINITSQNPSDEKVHGLHIAEDQLVKLADKIAQLIPDNTHEKSLEQVFSQKEALDKHAKRGPRDHFENDLQKIFGKLYAEEIEANQEFFKD